MEKKTLAFGVVMGSLLTAILLTSSSLIQPLSPIQPVTSQKPAQQLEKFKAGTFTYTCDACHLVAEAGKEKGIWAKYGLDPEFVIVPTSRPVEAGDIKQQVESGIKIGISITSEVLLARTNGVPVKTVAGYFGRCLSCKTFVKADGPIKTIKDLDGKKLGVVSTTSFTNRQALYISKKLGIKTEILTVGNLTNQVVALKVGRIDAFITGETAAMRLVSSGELRILINNTEVTAPNGITVSQGIWATEDLIEQNPEFVKAFVKATLETVNYLKENPSYAADLYIRRTNAPRDLADIVAAQIDWIPNGRGGGSRDLALATAKLWQYTIDTGIVSKDVDLKIEDTVDVRFLP